MSLLDATLTRIAPQDAAWRAKAKQRLDQLIMPHWALGRLMDLAVDLAGMTRSMQSAGGAQDDRHHGRRSRRGGRGREQVSAGSHAADGLGFVGGMAGISALARLAGARVVVVDMGVAADLSPLAKAGKIIDKKIALGTANIAAGPAMTREQAVRAVEAGIEVVEAAGRHDRRVRHRRHGHRQHHAFDRRRGRA